MVGVCNSPCGNQDYKLKPPFTAIFDSFIFIQTKMQIVLHYLGFRKEKKKKSFGHSNFDQNLLRIEIQHIKHQ